MSISSLIPALVVVSTVILDQISKVIIRSNMHYGESIPATGLFRITYVKNTGSAFGIFQDQTTWLILASILAIFVLVLLYRNIGRAGLIIRLFIALQIGGDLGNMMDRIRIGYVVDIIHIGLWPVFNIADSAITVGITGMIIVILFTNTDSNNSSIPIDQGPSKNLEADKMSD